MGANCSEYCCHLRELKSSAQVDINYGKGTLRPTTPPEFIYCCQPSNPSDVSVLLREASDRSRIASSLVIPLTSIRKVVSTNPCNPSCSYLIVYPYLKNSLLDDLNSRQLSREEYSEMEILRLVASISKAYKLLLKRGLRVSRVHPRNMFRGRAGWWRLLDVGWVGEEEEKVGEVEGEKHAYYNMRDFDQAKIKRNMEGNIVFSLGVLVLEMASLQPSINFYDFGTKRIRFNAIKDLLRQIKPKYYRIHHLIEWMLIQPTYQCVNLDKSCNRSRDLINLLSKGQEIIGWEINQGLKSEWEYYKDQAQTGYTRSTLNCSPSKLTWADMTSEKELKEKTKFSISKMKSYRNSSINPQSHRKFDSKITDISRPPSYEQRRTIRFPSQTFLR